MSCWARQHDWYIPWSDDPFYVRSTFSNHTLSCHDCSRPISLLQRGRWALTLRPHVIPLRPRGQTFMLWAAELCQARFELQTMSRSRVHVRPRVFLPKLAFTEASCFECTFGLCPTPWNSSFEKLLDRRSYSCQCVNEAFAAAIAYIWRPVPPKTFLLLCSELSTPSL